MRSILIIFILSIFFGCGDGNVGDFIADTNDSNETVPEVKDEDNNLSDSLPPQIPYGD
jgi:hypothetical protein